MFRDSPFPVTEQLPIGFSEARSTSSFGSIGRELNLPPLGCLVITTLVNYLRMERRFLPRDGGRRLKEPIFGCWTGWVEFSRGLRSIVMRIPRPFGHRMDGKSFSKDRTASI